MMHATNTDGMTKNISAISTWSNGATVSATKFFLKCIDDDLDSSAIYYYELRTAAGVVVAAGNLTMTGTDYENKTGNSYIWSWAASILGLTII